MGKLEREFCHDDECRAMARTIFGEARDQDWTGKVAVGYAILHRVNDKKKRWPRTIRGVVFQKSQYSCYGKGGHRPPIERFPEYNSEWRAAAECLLAAELVIAGKVDDPTDGSNHYAALWLWKKWKRKGNMPSWAKKRIPKRIGGHVFLRDR